MSSSFILCKNDESLLDGTVMYDKKWILYDNQQWPVQWLDWEEAPKHFPKPNLYQKKITVTVWWFAACLIHYGFLNPDETITCEKYVQQINEMHQRRNACGQHCSTERAQFFSMTTPEHRLHNQHFKIEWIGLWSFAFSHHIHLPSCQLITTSSSILTTFCRENACTTSRMEKMLCKSS